MRKSQITKYNSYTENNSFFSSHLPYLLKQGYRSTPIVDVEYFLVCRSQNPPKIFAQSKENSSSTHFRLKWKKIYVNIRQPSWINNEKLQSCWTFRRFCFCFCIVLWLPSHLMLNAWGGLEFFWFSVFNSFGICLISCSMVKLKRNDLGHQHLALRCQHPGASPQRGEGRC